jgi:uncharacterized integral membrane protein
MRLLCLLLLLGLGAMVATFALQNLDSVTLLFFNWSFPANIALVAGAGYLLGMLRGWPATSLVRRFLRREPVLGHTQAAGPVVDPPRALPPVPAPALGKTQVAATVSPAPVSFNPRSFTRG